MTQTFLSPLSNTWKPWDCAIREWYKALKGRWKPCDMWAGRFRDMLVWNDHNINAAYFGPGGSFWDDDTHRLEYIRGLSDSWDSLIQNKAFGYGSTGELCLLYSTQHMAFEVELVSDGRWCVIIGTEDYVSDNLELVEEWIWERLS